MRKNGRVAVFTPIRRVVSFNVIRKGVRFSNRVDHCRLVDIPIEKCLAHGFAWKMSSLIFHMVNPRSLKLACTATLMSGKVMENYSFLRGVHYIFGAPERQRCLLSSSALLLRRNEPPSSLSDVWVKILVGNTMTQETLSCLVWSTPKILLMTS